MKTRRPIIGNIQGGLSGPAIKPIALLKVMQVAEVARPHRIPIIGQGCICSAGDAIEVLVAGATTVGVGTALFYDPLACQHINAGIAAYLAEHKLDSVSALVGRLDAPKKVIDLLKLQGGVSETLGGTPSQVPTRRERA